MNGRIENQLKIEKNIQNTLLELPFFVIEWYNNLKASNKTTQSCNDFVNKIRNYLRSINENTKSVTLNELTSCSVEKYFISIQTKQNNSGDIIYTSDSYRQCVWCALNNFFKFLYKRKYLNENYMESISKPRNHDLERINEHRIKLTKEDFNNILKAVDSGSGSERSKNYQNKMKSRDKAIISLFMITGMRKTALVEINIQDLDLDNYKLYVTDKGNKRHIYDLSPSVVCLLNQWINDRKQFLRENTDALFISNRGDRINGSSVYNIVEKYSKCGLGYSISPHKLRAGFCSILYEETQNAEFVRRAVGHSNIATTQRYIVTENKEREKAVEIMSVLNF